jgi:DNA-directed RNA polymerase subunit RPC12/RpoP
MSNMSFKILKLYKSICLNCNTQLYLEEYVPRDGRRCTNCGIHAILSVKPAEVKIKRVPINDNENIPSKD